MKLNLGCGRDVRQGYVNVDLNPGPGVDQISDLSLIARRHWPWSAGTIDEIIMHDFLEHFPYRKTDQLLQEAWRILKSGGTIDVQVPDFSHCAAAALNRPETLSFLCNSCGTKISSQLQSCSGCGRPSIEIQDAAVARLYGGQDYDGNWHFTAFTADKLERHMTTSGFRIIEWPLTNENGETYFQNWNLRCIAQKNDDLWSE